MLRKYLLPIPYTEIIKQFVKRDLNMRYRGSILGFGWALIAPLLLLGIYTTVFVGIFQLKWPKSESGDGMEFAIQLFTGLLVFNLFAELTTKATTLITDQSHLVKKVLFPLEVLAWVNLFTALFHLCLGSLILITFITIFFDGLSATALFAPLAILQFIPLLLGLQWLIGAISIFIRDTQQIVNLSVTFLLFLSPIFYPLAALSDKMQILMWFNPLTHVIEGLRDSLLHGQIPDLDFFLISTLINLMICILGALVFERCRRVFPDVL